QVAGECVEAQSDELRPDVRDSGAVGGGSSAAVAGRSGDGRAGGSGVWQGTAWRGIAAGVGAAREPFAEDSGGESDLGSGGERESKGGGGRGPGQARSARKR